VLAHVDHLYADDTQLLWSITALDFSHKITHLENTVANVSNWMSSNFLSLNPSQIEFLIIGLPQQLSKLNNPIIHLPNLGVTLIKIFHLHHISKPCFHNIRDVTQIRNTTAFIIATSFIH